MKPAKGSTLIDAARIEGGVWARRRVNRQDSSKSLCRWVGGPKNNSRLQLRGHTAVIINEVSKG